MIVSAIVAVARNGVIGSHNQIPWYLPHDLKYFKRTTLNHHVVMGHHSYLSIGRPLPQRTNIIISRDPYLIVSNCLVAHSIEEALEMALDNGETEVFIIGGGQIYAQSTPYWDRLYLTEVDTAPEGDTFFPTLNAQDWQIVSSEYHPADEKNEYACTVKVLERIQAGSHRSDS